MPSVAASMSGMSLRFITAQIARVKTPPVIAVVLGKNLFFIFTHSFIKNYFKFVVITYKINNFLKYYSKESLRFKPKPLAIFFSIFTDGFKVPRSILDKSD